MRISHDSPHSVDLVCRLRNLRYHVNRRNESRMVSMDADFWDSLLADN